MLALLPLMLALAAPADRAVVLDPQGVLRWTDDQSEVALFGVNYYAAHWHDYLNLGVVGADRKAVTNQDVLHFKRLGIDLLRVHVFDRELSDHQGNLLANDHLAVLDHLLAECRRQGIHAVLTPIAWWGTPNDSPGFSTLYTMPQMTGDPGAPRAAQRRYLAQFAQHRNPETGLTYGEDPAIIAFELINEPIYADGTTDAQVTEYINALVDAVRGAGCRKLLFYNAWGGRDKACAASRIDGVTNNWYPTGLASGAEITGPTLHLVRTYNAFADPAVQNKPKGIYEFDCADVNRPVMYPAMARSFRAAGVQFATQFQYDAWPLADSNVNWQTHYLSLPFTPAKALSFRIAAAAFHALPRGQATGDADHFGATTVSHAQARSEFVTDTEFYTTGLTATTPPAPARLEHLAGGASPLVRYDGTGAWFLDRLAPGCWRLEVFPDAVPVRDPYGANRLSREVTRLLWAERRMALTLPDLGDGFAVEPVDVGNQHRPTAKQGAFAVRPGVYRLLRAGAKAVPVDPAYFAPPEAKGRPWSLDHRPPAELLAGQPFTVNCSVVPPTGADDRAPGSLTLVWADGGTWRRLPMTADGPYNRRATVPADLLREGHARYALVWQGAGGTVTVPGVKAPDEVAKVAPERLLDLGQPLAEVPNFGGTTENGTTCVQRDGALVCGAKGFAGNQAVGARLPARAPSAAMPADAVLVVRARASQPATEAFEIGLVLDDGRAYGAEVALSQAWREVKLPLATLRPLWGTKDAPWKPEQIRQVSLVYGAWLYGDRANQPHGFDLAWAELRGPTNVFDVPVWSPRSAIPLLRPVEAARRNDLSRGGRVFAVDLEDGGQSVEMAHRGFGPPPDSSGISLDLQVAGLPADVLTRCTRLRVRARSLTPAATAFELVIGEADGTPWGANIPLGPDWTTTELPLSGVRVWRGWPVPAGRGGTGDRPALDQLARLFVTFGSWLNPTAQGQPWRFEIAEISLVP
ncbi:MAG: cellulase family glycosylhydrolase [Armatimonadetes bacterium]|nr:cellulase family glycosylhydrolase [Armatimonadota bacterium]